MLTQRVWTVDDLDDLPDDGLRREALDGRLVVTPPRSALYQEVVFRLESQLRRQATPDWRVLHEQAVRLGSDWRIPDLLVVRADLPLTRHTYDPGEVGLVVEVVSPATVRTDRLVKPAEYAAARLERFWRVETDPAVTVAAYELRRTGYEPTEPSAPFPVVLDLSALQP